MASPLYTSTTRELAFDDMPEPLRSAFQTHAEGASLLLRDVRAWLTHRENPTSTSFLGSLFGRRSNPVDPDPQHDVVLVLHATHVLVGTHGPSRGTSVLSLPLVQATVSRGSALQNAFGANVDAPTDDGITSSGFPGTEGRPGTYFVGLGPGTHAEACVEAVGAAILRIKNPT